MPYIPAPGPGLSGTNGEILFPIEVLREVAAEILAQASLALDVHNQAWNTIQVWIDESAPTYGTGDIGGGLIDVRPSLNSVLQPHAQRLQASYEWQMSIAQAIFDAINVVETTEQEIASGFSGSGSSGQPAPSHGFVP